MMRALAAGLALALVACGGKVVFVEDDDGSGGSSSSSPSSAAGTQKFEPGPQPDTRGDLCRAVCPACSEPGCVEDCMDQFFGFGCDSFAGKVLTCFADGLDPDSCAFTTNCEAEVDDWTQCPMNQCSDGCSLADQDCSCLRQCDEQEFQMNCTMVADGQASCECIINGGVLTSCTETHLACDLDFGCCATAFGF